MPLALGWSHQAGARHGATQAVSQQTTANVLQATGSCRILHLELGPLDLDLLGLVVHLDRVVLDITVNRDQATC